MSPDPGHPAATRVGTSQLNVPFALPPDDGFTRSIESSLQRQRWIAPNGLEQNDGTTAHTAWPSFTHAMSRRNEWDVLQVLAGAGNYEAHVELYEADNGAADRPKVIRGVDANGNLVPPAARPVVVPVGGPRPITISSRYWIVEGLAIDCRHLQGSVGVYVLTGGQHVADYVAVRNCTIRNCLASAIQLVGAQHVVVDDNILVDNGPVGAPPSTDSNGVSLYRGTNRVRIRGNIATNNAGDGVQGEGQEAIVTNISIEGNIFNNNLENAVDLKGCEGVDIVRNIEFANYGQAKSVNPPDCGGTAIILHNSFPGPPSVNHPTRRVLIEGNNIHDSGIGISIGRIDLDSLPCEDIVVRYNYVHDITQAERNCGDAIQIQNVRRAEIYHNTFDRIAHSGVMVRIAATAPTSAVAQNVGVWRNTFANIDRTENLAHGILEGGYLDLPVDRMSGLSSDDNVYLGFDSAPRFRNGSTQEIIDFAHGVVWKEGLTTDTHSSAGIHQP